MSTLFAISVGEPKVHAGPASGDKAAAEDLFGEGMDLREKGDHVGALAKFEAAHRLVASPITTLELGRAYLLLGRLVEALKMFEAAAAFPPKPSESTAAKAARAEAKRLAADVEARIPTITVRVTGVPPGETPIIKLDDIVLDPEEVGAKRRVDPGKHRLLATLPNAAPAPIERPFTVKEGETRELTLAFPTFPTPRGRASFRESDRAPTPPERGSTGAGPWVLVIGGAVLAGAGVGGYFAASSARSERCLSVPAGAVCETQDLQAVEAVGIGAAVVGVGVVGLGTVLLFRRPAPATRASAPDISAGIGWGSIHITGVF